MMIRVKEETKRQAKPNSGFNTNRHESAQPIKSVVMYATGDSVVAGLVPATNPWYGIFPTHQRD